MKRDFLKGLGLTDEQIDSVMAENGKDINDMKKTADDLKAAVDEADGLKKQLADRDKDIKSLQEKAKGNDDLTKQLNDMQTKYKTDTESLQKQISDQKVDFAVETMFAAVPFASNLARKAAIADFKSKGYKLKDDGKFEGADGYIDQLKKEDPAAFKTENKDAPQKPDEKPGNQPPKFTNQLNNSGGTPETNPFSFNFTPVRNPNQNK